MAERGKVLLVDDDKDICETITDVLEIEDYSVTSVNSGMAALEAVEKNKYDVVLLDMIMPGMNGVETLKKFKKIAPGTPVIMVSAFSVEDMIRESLKEGAFTILKKPIDFESLFSTIEMARGNGGLVLVVDDDKDICEVVRYSLEEKGYMVKIALEGESAVEKTRDIKFDVIILDMKLPIMNGFETFLSIRNIRPDVCVILITGYPESMGSLIEKAMNKGAYLHLRKPINMDELFEILKEIMQRLSGT